MTGITVIIIHSGLFPDCLNASTLLAYETGENKFIISKDNLTEEFFHLSNKIAGNILQKLINYKMKLAIIGDFSNHESNALNAFIYECNQGNDIFFVSHTVLL